MKTIRVFTVEVSGCGNCPFSDARFGCKELPMNKVEIENPFGICLENFIAITPTCPRYAESIVKTVKE